MSLIKKDLAEAINEAIAATDANGEPIKVTPEMETYAEAIITTLTTSTFSHLLVEGVTAPGAPLQNGAANGGLFLPPLPPATWLGVLTAGFPTADPASLSIEATCSTTYLSGASLVNFEAGKIVGQCTSAPLAPGPLAAGAGSDGKIDGIDGDSWASVCVPPPGDPALASKIYKAIVKYIKANAEAAYLPQTINGVCPPGGGPLAAGLGVGGTVI